MASPILKHIGRLIREILGASRRQYRVYYDENYFEEKFANHRNFLSISFECGVAKGQFKGSPYLIKTRPRNIIESYVYINDVWEPHIAEIISGYLGSIGGALVDVGANIGATSIPLAKYHEGSHFYLFEPHPFIFEDLQDNISFNRLNNVTAVKIAITDSLEPSLPFYAQKKTAKNSGLSSLKLNYDIEDHEVVEVGCISLDAFFRDSGAHIRVVKIDTQGHELNVLRSAKETLRRHRPVVIFEFESEYFNDAAEEEAARKSIMELFEELAYELYMIADLQKYMPRVTLSGYFHGDIIALPLQSRR